MAGFPSYWATVENTSGEDYVEQYAEDAWNEATRQERERCRLEIDVWRGKAEGAQERCAATLEMHEQAVREAREAGRKEGMAFAANVERHGGTMGEGMEIECAVADAALCGDLHDGWRCNRLKGHAGDHQDISPGGGRVGWSGAGNGRNRP